MSRKDYVAIAGAIIKARLMYGPREDFGTAHTALDVVTSTIGDALAADSECFDRARFERAAGVEAGQ